MEHNVKNLLLIILILLVVRWAVDAFFPVLHGLVYPVSIIVLVWSIWDLLVKPVFFGR